MQSFKPFDMFNNLQSAVVSSSILLGSVLSCYDHLGTLEMEEFFVFASRE
jgi:hypothetical protein